MTKENKFFIWEEKNSTERPMKLESNRIFARNGGINEIKSVSAENVCEDIGNESVWKRNCPKCGKEIIHKNIKSYRHSIINDKVCVSCTLLSRPFTHHILINKSIEFNNIFHRECPKCGNRIFYKRKYDLENGIIKNTSCSSCCIKGKKYPYKPMPAMRGENHWGYGKRRKKEK